MDHRNAAENLFRCQRGGVKMDVLQILDGPILDEDPTLVVVVRLCR